MRVLVCAVVLTVAVGVSATAFAQTVETAPSSDPLPTSPQPAPTPVTVAAASPACCHVASGFPVLVQLTNEVSSKTVKPGDTFALTLAMPIIVNGKVLVPAGAVGRGEVVDSARAGLMGSPGKLVLASRYVDYGGMHIPLRAFKLGGAGNNNLGVAFGVAILVSPVLAMAIPGSDIVYAPGTQAVAKVAADITLSPVTDPAAPVAVVASPTAQATPAAPTPTAPPPSPISAQRPTP